jgi:CRISPR system Cascade subunit CasA
MSRYNLIDEKWIPVRDLSGARKELGILDALTNAEKLASIEDASPLVTAALHRFLLAVLYRALEGPCDVDEAKKVFREGLPKEKIQKYLETWKARFWLFDEKYPFGQNPNIPENEIEPWTKLTSEYNSTTNKVLFDHTETSKPGERNPSECARWLLSIMSFSVAGGRGYYTSPSPNAVICIPIGANLADTLRYLLVPQNKNVLSNDLPIWEKTPSVLPIATAKRIATGYADLYTWPARFVLLNQTSSGNVTFVRFVAGEGFDKSCLLLDPMQTFRKDNEKGLLPIQFKERGFWRDFQSILPGDNGFPPKVIENSIFLAKNQKNRMPGSIMVLGLRNEPPSANLEFWRMERFALPEAILGNRSIREDIHSYLQDAEDASKSLYSACANYAKLLLSRGDRTVDKKDIKNFLEQMSALPSYWSTLEAKFHEVLHDYTIDKKPEEIRHDWLVDVRKALSDSWKLHKRSIAGSDAWAIRALVKSEDIIAKKIVELNKTIQTLKEVP